MDLHEQIDKIKTKEDLAEFIGYLREDLSIHRECWENPTLDQFLEAMEAWILAMDFWAKNKEIPPVDIPSWKLIANILYAAKIYE